MSDYPDMPGVRPGSPDTAIEAALSMADVAKSRERQAMVLISANAANGCTSDEVADTLGWERYSSRPRLSTLKARGEIVDSGKRRKGTSGRNQAVWVLPEYGPPPPPDPQGDLLAAM
ncbi:hypothetical protein [Novosphingobium sp.]|uniref:hypothetical protein n=1 Tax=Novosphingobium sp. TaxID=1874826 RepID=UPI002633579C|nr:hypothetical protein [Novosphingobium sp.]